MTHAASSRRDSWSDSGASGRHLAAQIAPVTDVTPRLPLLRRDVYERAINARDARFDGVFYVGITTTRVYCRPVCPSRVARSAHRRFFNSAAAAERAGFRPCLRCRPELAPGRPWVTAVQQLAAVATHRIHAGELNGRSVAQLAGELGVSERHLRRVLERELGVSPVELAQTHRLLLAKRLLADTRLSVTQIAYASGFQSVRRFNSVFREHYRMPPTAVRRVFTASGGSWNHAPGLDDDLVGLTLGYRPPLAWEPLLAILQRDAVPLVEVIDRQRYARTVRLGQYRGVLYVTNTTGQERRDRGSALQPHLRVAMSASLVPALMPLLARVRQLFDLDAEPAVIDRHLTQGGLGALVAAHPGVRVPGALDGFEVALRILMGGVELMGKAARERMRRVVRMLGEPIESGVPALSRLTPTAGDVAEAGPARLIACGLPSRRAQAIVAVARLVADGQLRLEPAGDLAAAHAALAAQPGIGERLATIILMRAQRWPDAFPATDGALQRAASVASAGALNVRAELWRPWRAYAAMHLWLEGKRDR